MILPCHHHSRRSGIYRPALWEHAAGFIIARGVLRILLGRYLDVAPTAVRFRYNPFGKPALAQDSGADALHFNVSHTDGVALYAVARRRRVGLDLERIRVDMAI